jgi:putative transposase
MSFTVEVTRQVPVTPAPGRVVGVDVGITTLYTGATPDGEQVLEVDNPRHFVTAEKKLAHAQRIASRRQGPKPGVAPSKRWKKANTRVQNIHAGVRNARKNLIHETTSILAKNYDVIVLEDLNVAGMVKRQLKRHQKSARRRWFGSELGVVRFLPHSNINRVCRMGNHR